MIAGFGCKGLSQTEQELIQPVTLNYWTVYNDVAQLQAMASEYQQIRPYVRVNVRQVRYEEFDRLFVNALADDVAPDIVSMHVRWLNRYTNRLSPMPATVNVANIAVSGTYSKDTVVTQQTMQMPTKTILEKSFVSTVADDVIIRGSVYGIPLALDSLALYYNKDLLDKAGIPEAPQTWAEFLDAVKKTTRFSADGRVIQSGVPLGTGKNVDYSSDILTLLVMQNRAKMAIGSHVSFADNVDRFGAGHPTIEALRFYTDFARPTKEVYAWNTQMESGFDAFTRGKAVFYFGYAFDLPRIKGRAPQMNLEVVPVPQLNASDPVNVANYWVESVVKKSRHQNEAWDFIRFITTPDKIKIYTDATKRPSPLRQHIADQEKDPLLAPFASAVLHATNWYHGRNVDDAGKAIDDMIEGYLSPVPDGQDGAKRDIQLIQQSAQRVQQTM